MFCVFSGSHFTMKSRLCLSYGCCLPSQKAPAFSIENSSIHSSLKEKRLVWWEYRIGLYGELEMYVWSTCIVLNEAVIRKFYVEQFFCPLCCVASSLTIDTYSTFI